MSDTQDARDKVNEELGRWNDFAWVINNSGAPMDDGTREIEMREIMPKLVPLIKAQHQAIVALLLALESLEDRVS